jgi:hypothetical protein
MFIEWKVSIFSSLRSVPGTRGPQYVLHNRKLQVIVHNTTGQLTSLRTRIHNFPITCACNLHDPVGNDAVVFNVSDVDANARSSSIIGSN